MTYKHMSSKERDQLAVWRSRGLSLRDISARLGRSIGTLSRELHRNRGRGGYFAQHAQEQSDKRLKTGHKRLRLKSRILRFEVEQMLVKGWSPEIISGRMPQEHSELPLISPEAIYQWIYSDRPDLIGCLVRAHPKRWPRRYRRYAPRPPIPGRVPLTERPQAANDRQEVGHWETDLVVGPGLEALQVSVERQTRYTQLRKVTQKTAPLCRAALTQVMAALPPKLRQSITYDNGSENYEHGVINDDFDMRSYFCQPYHSWEKGTVENTNGLVRRFIPKRTPLGSITAQRVQEIEDWMNDRPRKCLKFKTAGEAFKTACCT